MRYECGECQKRFARRPHLKYHIKGQANVAILAHFRQTITPSTDENAQ